MRVCVLAAFLVALSPGAGSLGFVSPSHAQTDEEGSEGPSDGKGSGCDHRKEDTIS